MCHSIFTSWIVLWVLTLPGAVRAQFTYATNNDSITITGYTGPGGAVTIPSAINGLPVTSIGSSAFYDNTSLTNVTIPDSVTTLENSAFEHCTELTSVTIPNSVTNLAKSVFAWCTRLTNVMIPESVTSIGVGPFAGCDGLGAITVEPLNPAYSSVDGVLFDKSQTKLIQCPGGKPGGYTIPISVTNIAYQAFQYCTHLNQITIPDSVTTIEFEAFRFCTGLTSITIPDSVTSIGIGPFAGCESLQAITVAPLNAAYSSVDGILFDKSQTTLIQFPGGKAGSYAVPNGVTSIGWQSFYYCMGLTNVTVPPDVTSIAGWAFQFCTSLASIDFQGNAPSLAARVFEGDDNATVYYLPATAGWGPTFGGLPTALVQTHNAFRISPSGSPTPGAPYVLTITAVDQYQNIVTNVTGDHSFTFAGLAVADDGTCPTITDKTGAPVRLGTATTITFSNGVSSAGGTLRAYKAQTSLLTGSDATSGKTTSDTGGTGVNLTIANANPLAGPYTAVRQAGVSLKILIGDLLANDTDANHDKISIAGVDAASTQGATIWADSTYVYYVPNGAGDGDTFHYFVSDGQGGSAAGIISISFRRANPNVTAWPTASAITYGQSLASSTLTGGSSSVSGTFAFTTPSMGPSAGTADQSVTFTPTDLSTYTTAVGSTSVTVNKATPTASLAVTNSPVIYDGTAKVATVIILSSSVPGAVSNILIGGAASQKAAGTYAVTAEFVPTDSANYSSLPGLPAGNFAITPANSVTKLVCSPDPSLRGSNVIFTATVSSTADTPTGEVVFEANGVPFSTNALVAGVATASTSALPTGTNTVTAEYVAQGNDSDSSQSLNQVVLAAETPSTLAITDNNNGTVTISFAGTPDANYVVQAADNVAAPVWSNVSTNIAGADGQWTFTEAKDGHLARVYRSAKP